MPCLLIHLWAFSGDIDFVWYAEISILISKHAILSSIAAPRQTHSSADNAGRP
jgi:hypothetical protein